jgi:FMN phosphatase YigB (HAD superfamily)
LRQLEALAIPHAILTNGWIALTRAKAEAVGFSGTVLVSDAPRGVSKPQETAFAALAAVLGLPPDRIWYVGTDPRVDMAAAQKAGFNAVWLCPDEHGAPFPPDLPPPAHIIRRLDELLEILREPYTRSLLGLRYILHNVLEWPPGSFAAGGVEYGLGAEEPAP